MSKTKTCGLFRIFYRKSMNEWWTNLRRLLFWGEIRLATLWRYRTIEAFMSNVGIIMFGKIGGSRKKAGFPIENLDDTHKKHHIQFLFTVCGQVLW